MNSKNAINKHMKKDDSINLLELLNVLLNNWKVFLISASLFLGIGVFYLLTKNKIYTVDALILLREEDGNNGFSSSPLSMLSGGASDLFSIMGSNNVDNEITVLNTRKIMKQSILDLNLHVSCKSKKGLKTVNLYPDGPFYITVDPSKVDTLKYRLQFSINPLGNNQYKISGKYRKTKFEAVISEFPATIKTPSIDIFIDKKNAVGLKTEKKKEEKKIDVRIFNPNILAIVQNKQMSIATTNKKTSVIKLATQTNNIKLSQDLIYRLIERFNQYAIEDKNLIAEKTREFVESRLEKITGELASVEKQAEKYKQDNNLTDISSEAKLFLEQMGRYEKNSIETQIQLNMIQYIGEYVKNPENQEKLIPSIGIEDIGLLTTIAKYNETLLERNSLEKSSSGSNPALVLMNSRLISMRENISANIGNIYRSLEIMLRDIKNQDIKTNSRIKAVPKQEREFLEIKRQQEVKQAIYSFLLQKREETDLALVAIAPKAKIIDEPMPGIEAVAPKKLTTFAVMLVLGLGIPFLWFYFRKFLNSKIETREEIENLIDVEIIGDICQTNTDDRIVVKPHETNTIVELFRLLRTNLMFVLADASQKVILLTSTVSGEGKSFISINLALSLALTEKKVLLVGLDIRSPKLGEYIHLPKIKGVTNYLTETELTPQELIQPSAVHPCLDIVQAGPIPPNPNELLLRKRLDELFAAFREQYDYIIVDTAPIGIVSDTFLLNRLADVFLYVFRIGYADTNAVSFLNSINEGKKLKNLYAVVNGIDLKLKNSVYGKYGYSKNHF